MGPLFVLGLLVLFGYFARSSLGAGKSLVWVLAVLVWVLSTVLAAALIWLLLLGFGISRAKGETDAHVWSVILLGYPFYLLPTWIAISAACFAVMGWQSGKRRRAVNL